jgi:hypothetical protein
MKKRYFATILMGVLALSSAMGQVSKTLSPYSQFGLGVMADQSQSANRGMNGLGIAIHDSKSVNMLNPASYASVDSLTMIFDMGISGQMTNFKEGGKRINRKTADFDYAVALFRVRPKMGVSVGVVPYSNIGYNYSTTEQLRQNDQTTLISTSTYAGSGGISQAYLGIGWEVLKGLSVGANASFFWGRFDKSVSVVKSESTDKTLTETYSATINTYKLDFGVQYQHRLNKNSVLTVGAIAGLGHKLGADARMSTVYTDPQTSVSQTTTDSVPTAYEIPFTFGLGAALKLQNRLTVGADYTMQKWGSLDYPMKSTQTADHKLGYQSVSGQLKDRHKVTLGAEYVPNPMSRRFLHRVHYRIGAYYATPYYKIKGQDGPKEISLSAGFGFPIVNSWNNRSHLNISAQWVRSSASNFMTENTFRINIGLTFNERWFAKWKVD